MKPIQSSAVVFSVLLFLSLFFNCCHKAGNNGEITSHDIITSARAYVQLIQNQSPLYQNDNPHNDRTTRSRELLWSSAWLTQFRGRPAVLVPVQFSKDIFVKTTWGGNNCFRLNNQERLLVYQDSTRGWHAERVIWLPDSLYLRSNQTMFTGIVLVDDYWGNPLNKYNYAPDGSVQRYVPGQTEAARTGPKQITESVKSQGFIQTCKYVYGYNYAIGDENNGEYWVEFEGCSTMYTPDGAAGGSGGGGSYGGIVSGGSGNASGNIHVNLAASPVIYSPTRIITDIRDYLKCFQNTPGATFQVTVCVDEPSPGSRNPWVIKLDDGASGSGATSAGHTYLVLTENMPGGWSITRNVGFYPSKGVWPLSDPVPGVLNNDETSPFNIAAQYNISNTLFFAMLQYIIGSADSYYQVNTFNCTNFALDALDVGHIYLPHTIGYWIGGMGVDPGDLGEDIRGFDFTGMTRITTPFFHSNLGICN
ncbi:MAG TPA: hypothetical protein VHD83_23180 [Puia sp.]|nr:hypothetical protein [Puia sp.]